MNKFLVIILLFGITSIGFAQNDSVEEDSKNKEFKPVLLSYISLSSSFETYNSLDFGLMKDMGPQNAIGVELGYIYNIEGLNQRIEDSWFNDVYGMKAYLYYRFFLDLEDQYPSNSKTFIDIESQLYWASFKAERIAGYSCDDTFGNCEYYRFFDSRVDRLVPGLNIKMGKLYDYDPFYVTLFIGMGYRYIYEFSDMTTNDVLPDEIFNRRGEKSDLQTGGRVRLRLGFQLAYNLWR